MQQGDVEAARDADEAAAGRDRHAEHVLAGARLDREPVEGGQGAEAAAADRSVVDAGESDARLLGERVDRAAGADERPGVLGERCDSDADADADRADGSAAGDHGDLGRVGRREECVVAGGDRDAEPGVRVGVGAQHDDADDTGDADRAAGRRGRDGGDLVGCVRGDDHVAGRVDDGAGSDHGVGVEGDDADRRVRSDSDGTGRDGGRHDEELEGVARRDDHALRRRGARVVHVDLRDASDERRRVRGDDVHAAADRDADRAEPGRDAEPADVVAVVRGDRDAVEVGPRCSER